MNKVFIKLSENIYIYDADYIELIIEEEISYEELISLLSKVKDKKYYNLLLSIIEKYGTLSSSYIQICNINDKYLIIYTCNDIVEITYDDKSLMFNKSTEEYKCNTDLIAFMEYLVTITSASKIRFNYDFKKLFKDLGYYNEKEEDKVINSGELSLSYKKDEELDLSDIKLEIVRNTDSKIIGHYTLNLNKVGESNFSCYGNVGLFIKEEYRNLGYGKKSFELLKDFVRACDDTYNKTLYMSIKKDNIASNRIASKEADLVYTSELPTSKKTNVNIYKLELK